MSDLFDVID